MYELNKKQPIILGIESSCDETAAAVIRGRKILSDEIASRAHTDAIAQVVERAVKNAGITYGEIDAVAVTYGAGLLGALLVGVSRPAGAEFTFFLAIPVMAGASAIKLLKFFMESGSFSGAEIGYLLIGAAVAFAVSCLAIKFLMNFVKKHDFKLFGWYRIALGAIVIATLVIPTFF